MTYYKPPIYDTEEDLQKVIDKFEQYHVDNPDKIPHKARLEYFLGVADSTRRAWKQEGHRFKSQIDAIEKWIKSNTVDVAYSGNKHAEFQLGRAFHMSEKTEVALSGDKDNPLQILVQPVDIAKPKDSESGTTIDL